MNLKNEKGISLMTMVITVIIMFIIVGMIVYSSENTVRVRDINNLNNDVKTIQEKVDLFYLEYGVLPYALDYSNLPIKYEYIDPANIPEGDEGYKSQLGISNYISVLVNNNPYRNPNDNDVYYEINLNNFQNLSLTYYSSKIPDRYVYVVNEQSHSVYMVSGIRIDGEYYYSPDYSNIPKIDI